MTNIEIKDIKETPLMKQYNSFKAKYPGALLLFRVGDFYETFGEDAIIASKILGIVLTKRANGSATFIELAGFPHHSIETYLPKLVRAGQRVAICDQLEDPKLTKTIVKRGVTEVISPGVSYKENTLDHKNNNFLCAVHFDGEHSGVAFLDLSTGEFFCSEGNSEYIDKLLQSFKPSEVLYQRAFEQKLKENYGDKFYTYKLDEWVFQYDYSYETLIKHFDTLSLKGFGIEELKLGIIAAGACLHYIKEAQHQNLRHISAISRVEEDKFLWLDRFTIRNLELNFSANDGALRLIDVMDATITPMGARTLNKWLLMPLKDIKAINDRLDSVEKLISQKDLFLNLSKSIQPIGDLERLISRISLQKASPREINQLKRALEAIAEVKKHCEASEMDSLTTLASQLNPCQKIIEKISNQLKTEPPNNVLKGDVIANGVDEELDELRKISSGGKNFLLEIQNREAIATGINSLKVAFNNVFGYYLEVTNLHKNKVPETWIRKQTLSNAERYITPELKEYEDKILGAEEKIIAIEIRIFNQLILDIGAFTRPIQLNAQLIATLDALMSFSKIAKENNYVRPILNEGFALEIKQGRHPVIEKKLAVGETYIPNDIYLDDTTQQIIMITGPNMSGKSAILRQTGLIVLMAQMGSFVPAKSANIGIVDKIFTRVGASDNISSGESTFMVEMNETASILNNFSNRSLILLDEIGRGTSTYDGISIAWSIAEYLHDSSMMKPKTLFATHYHELNEMENSFPRIKNFNVSVKELDKKVLFLRKLIPGGSEHSFGIHVAKMAGMPVGVIARANEVLAELELQRTKVDTINIDLKKKKNEPLQFKMFSLEDPVLIKIRDEINNLEINSLTPVEALMKLDKIKKLMN